VQLYKAGAQRCGVSNQLINHQKMQSTLKNNGKIQNEDEKKMKIRWEHRIFKPAAQHAHAGALEEEGGGEGDEEEGEKEEEGGKNSAATRIPPRINLTFHVHTAEEEEKNENGGKVDVAAPEPPKVHTLLRPSVLNQRRKNQKGSKLWPLSLRRSEVN
jgi:hypothetical protein